jgi:EAL domain-containing protein (putative c-di-GMP-specific phosphodiesterase class I)
MGMIPPIKFIPLAEESGLIESIGEWVLRTACRQNREWQDLGYTPIRMPVNLSAVQFHQPELFETVAAVLEATGLDARWLELELTESMLMNDPRTTIATLRRFKDVGIHLSIDDFGTGYSSLSYLKRFPIDALKIDRSFVREITTNPDDAAIATAIILMGHSLKLDVVAEGVETESQLSFLQILQCNEIQGYLISPPVPAAKAQNFLVAHRAITIS